MTQSKQPLPESIRRLDTPEGTIFYVLRRKRVKNLNLRVGSDGIAALSIPWHMPQVRAEAFLREKSGWILQHLRQAQELRPDLPPQPPRRQPPRGGRGSK